MIRKFLSLAFIGLLLVACKDNNAEAPQTETPTVTTEAVQTETPTQPAVETPAQVEVQSVQQPTNSGPIIQQQTQQIQQTTGQTAPGWSGKPNPPHGQEGHRCDIQVGAILP